MGIRSAVAIGIVIGVVGSAAPWSGSGRFADAPTVRADPPRPVPMPTTDSGPVVGTAPRVASSDAQPSTPDYGPPTDVSTPIYRCGARGSTVYSNTPCAGARVVDGASAVSGYDSRPSERMARLVAQGRSVEAPTSVGPVSGVRRRDTDEGQDCPAMRRQIVDIDADASRPHDRYWLDELRSRRQDVRTRMAREHC